MITGIEHDPFAGVVEADERMTPTMAEAFMQMGLGQLGVGYSDVRGFPNEIPEQELESRRF